MEMSIIVAVEMSTVPFKTFKFVWGAQWFVGGFGGLAWLVGWLGWLGSGRQQLGIMMTDYDLVLGFDHLFCVCAIFSKSIFFLSILDVWFW